MPHLTIEYSNNLCQFDPQNALLKLNQALIDSGHFSEADIKSRAIHFDHFLIGNQAGRAFIHIKLCILSNRPAAIKKELATAMLAALSGQIANPDQLQIQICAEIIDIDRESYSKEVLS